jgi:hypothetical protein
MNLNSNLIISFVLVFIAQILAYFQLQGQFMFPWVKKNPIFISLLGVPISYILIKFTKYCADAFDGEVWPGRLIGFAVGAIVFALLSHFIMKEEFSLKTIVSLSLASMILLIQIFWK